jgi:hypothetical protein
VKRKVVQIAVAAVGYDTENAERFEERLYALDSTGAIWEWRSANATHKSGWAELANPWESPPVPKAPKVSKGAL